jgi:hypothetical protein
MTLKILSCWERLRIGASILFLYCLLWKIHCCEDASLAGAWYCKFSLTLFKMFFNSCFKEVLPKEVTMDMQKSTLYFIKGCKMWEMMFDKSNG